MVYKKSTIKVLLGPETLKKAHETNAFVDEIGGDKRRLGHRRRPDDQVFEKIGETNVYKRIRPFQALKSRPKFERCPSSLQLSGQKVENEDTKLNLKSARNSESRKTPGTDDDFGNIFDDMDTRSNHGGEKPKSAGRDLPSEESYSPSLQRTRRERAHNPATNTISQNFLTEFGLRTERTDTFSGHQRRRGLSANMERQLELSAERHIRTCQVVGNVKWSSRAQQSCQGLKDTVSPLNSPKSIYSERLGRYNSSQNFREKSFYKSDMSLDSGKYESAVPYMIQIRKHVGSTSRIKPLGKTFTATDTIPGINSRTLIVGTSMPFL